MQLRWGLVGLGRLADENIAPAIATSVSGQLIACASRTRERAEQFATAHGVSRPYSSYEELVRDPEVDAVFISNQNNLHYPVVLAAAAAGKHILCEKPMALAVDEAEEMVESCRKAGVILCIGFQNRFCAVLQAASGVVREGRLGTVREVAAQRYGPLRGKRSAWRNELATAGSGALADMGVHVIDYVQWIVGDRISRVFAMAYPPRSSGRPDDTVTVALEFAGGCQATLRCSREMPRGANDLQAFGTDGMLATGPLRFTDVHRLAVRTPDESEDLEYPIEDLYRLEVEAFARAVEGERTLLGTGNDGLRMVRVVDAVIRSLETGASVPVNDDWRG